MENMQAMESIAAARHASPIRQSKTKSVTIKPRTIAIDPTVSGVLWAMSPSVAPAQPSITRRSAPEAWVSK